MKLKLMLVIIVLMVMGTISFSQNRRGSMNASGWGFTCSSAIQDAESNANIACVNIGGQPGATMQTNCTCGLFYCSATATITCDK